MTARPIAATAAAIHDRPSSVNTRMTLCIDPRAAARQPRGVAPCGHEGEILQRMVTRSDESPFRRASG